MIHDFEYRRCFRCGNTINVYTLFGLYAPGETDSHFKYVDLWYTYGLVTNYSGLFFLGMVLVRQTICLLRNRTVPLTIPYSSFHITSPSSLHYYEQSDSYIHRIVTPAILHYACNAAHSPRPTRPSSETGARAGGCCQ